MPNAPARESDAFLLFEMVVITLAGLVCTIFSLLLTGAGHGWFAPIFVSWIALPAGPFAALMARSRDSTGGMIILISLLLVAIGCDVFLFGPLGTDSGTSSPAHAWSAVSIWMTVWLVTWAGWQVIALAAITMRIWTVASSRRAVKQ